MLKNKCDLSFISNCENRDILACAGKLFLERSYNILKNSKHLMRAAHGIWLPEYRFFQIMGQTMKMQKSDSKLLLRFLVEGGYIELDGRKNKLLISRGSCYD